MDEVKIIELSNSKSFLSHPQNRNLQPDIVRPYSSHSKNLNTLHRNPVQPDNVRNLNLSLTTSLLRELYKYTSTSNGSTSSYSLLSKANLTLS
jgi:hypothetical protein